MTLPLPYDDIVPTEDEIAEVGVARAMIAAFQRAQANYEKLRQQWPLGAEGLARSAAVYGTVPTVSIAHSTTTPLTLATSPVVNGAGLSWSAGAPTRVTVGQGGVYLANVAGRWPAPVSPGRTYLGVRENGAVDRWAGGEANTTGGDDWRSFSSVLRLTAGGYVEALAHQANASSAALNLTNAELRVVRVGTF